MAERVTNICRSVMCLLLALFQGLLTFEDENITFLRNVEFICQRNGIHIFPFLESVERTSTKKTGRKIMIRFLRPGKGTLKFHENGEFLKTQWLAFWERDVQKLSMIGTILLHILNSFTAWIRTFTFIFTCTIISWKYYHDRSVVGN
jgi:hypothetical protein